MPGYLNMVFGMLGTIVIWVYWPSANAALASVPMGTDLTTVGEAVSSSQYFCYVNTLMALLGSAVATFATSALIGKGKVAMVHMHNSTVSGGVAIGAACAMRLTIGAPFLIGAVCGALSVLGISFVLPLLDKWIGLGDTGAIMYVHALPGVFGGLVAGLAALSQDSNYLKYPSGGQQLAWEVIATLFTTGMATAGKDLSGP